MKKISFCLVLLFLLGAANAVFAQMPTQAEMDAMMKQMQGVMKDMPPETKKMMDSMGIKLPDAKQLPTNKQLASMQTKQGEMKVQASKSRKLALEKLPKQRLTKLTLPAFLQQSLDNISKGITTKAKETAQDLLTAAKSKKASPLNTAISVLLSGGQSEALWMLAKTSVEDPSNANLLNVYSAIAIHCNAPQIALPILQKLNYEYPNNSSVLNNLGQAWLGLDKKDSAELYLKKTIGISRYHSSANESLARICGDPTKALAYLKNAIKGEYSPKLASAIKKAGYKLKAEDISWNLNYDKDPLNLQKINIPDYPADVTDSKKLEAEWKAFKEACSNEARELRKKADELSKKVANNTFTMINEAINKKSTKPLELPLAEKAGLFFGEDIEAGFFKMQEITKERFDFAKERELQLKAETERAERIEKEMNSKYNGRCPGEGCPYESYCPDVAAKDNESANQFLGQVNPKNHSITKKLLQTIAMTASANANISLYRCNSPEQLEMETAIGRASYLDVLAGIEYDFRNPSSETCGMTLEKGKIKVKLADYDEVTCKDKLMIGFGIGKFSFTCTKFSIEGGELIQGSFEKDLISGDSELGIGIGFGEHVGYGPMNGDVSMKAMLMFKVNSNGELVDKGFKIAGGVGAGFAELSAESEANLTVWVDAGASVGVENSYGLKFAGE